jgi:alcohol dehydrogenase
MRQLTFLKPGAFEWRDVPAPRLQADTDAIVRPLAVARCDLDLYIATGVAPYAGPFAFGHEMAGEVVEAGDKAGVAPGDRVVVPFQLSCGRCDACRRGWTNSCAAYRFAASYGLAANGRKTSAEPCPTACAYPSPITCCLPSQAGWSPRSRRGGGQHGRRLAGGRRPAAGTAGGQRAGGRRSRQSVSLYAVAAAVALGAGRVLYLDDDPRRRALARHGAEAEALALADGRFPAPFEVVVEGAGDAAALAFCVALSAPNGVLTSVSMHFGATTPVPLTTAYMRGLTFHTGRVHSRAVLPEVMGCLLAATARGGRHTADGELRRGRRRHDRPRPKLVFVAGAT